MWHQREQGREGLNRGQSGQYLLLGGVQLWLVLRSVKGILFSDSDSPE